MNLHSSMWWRRRGTFATLRQGERRPAASSAELVAETLQCGVD
jgi:hypothetical protein